MTTLREKHLRWMTPTIIRIARKFHLTMAGSIELTQFSEEALSYAMKSMKMLPKDKRLQLYDPFIYFLGICHKVCKKDNIYRNISFTKSLKLEFGIKPDMELVVMTPEERFPFEEDEEKKLKKTQKRDNAIWSSSLNAQLSYRKPSGERPSVAAPSVVKNLFAELYNTVFGKKTT